MGLFGLFFTFLHIEILSMLQRYVGYKFSLFPMFIIKALIVKKTTFFVRSMVIVAL